LSAIESDPESQTTKTQTPTRTATATATETAGYVWACTNAPFTAAMQLAKDLAKTSSTIYLVIH